MIKFIKYSILFAALFSIFCVPISTYQGIPLEEQLFVYKELAENNDVDLIKQVMLKFNAPLSNSQKSRIAELIVKEAKIYDFDPIFVTSLIAVESSFNPNAISDAGAVGLMQMMPYVGKAISNQLGVEWNGMATLVNIDTNIKLGMYFLNTLSKQYDEDQMIYLAAYNFGPTFISNKLDLGLSIPKKYAHKVLRRYLGLKSSAISI